LVAVLGRPSDVDLGVYYRVLSDVSIAQVMFMGGVLLVMVGLLALAQPVDLARPPPGRPRRLDLRRAGFHGRPGRRHLPGRPHQPRRQRLVRRRSGETSSFTAGRARLVWLTG